MTKVSRTPVEQPIQRVWRVWLRPNAERLDGRCELCGVYVVVAIPFAFFYEFDDSRFPVCLRCALNYGVRLPTELANVAYG